MAGTVVRTLVCWRDVVFDVFHGSGERPEGRVLDQDVLFLLDLILPRAWVCDKIIRWSTPSFGLDPRRVLHHTSENALGCKPRGKSRLPPAFQRRAW